jgi:WXG100 family type VII secretion target
VILMSSPIAYNFDGIDSLSGQIATFVSQMNETLAEVDRTFQNLLANDWHGAGADAFGPARDKWNSNAQQMAETLQNLAGKLSNSAMNMHQADAAAAARF